jgi:NADH-quinone oxidoreductase subunit N
MNIDYLLLMKSELSITLIIFILLILKIRGNIDNNSGLFNLINIFLFLNFALGFFFNKEGIIFDGMMRNTGLLALEKNILNFGVLIISLQAYTWLKNHKHVVEFYLLLLSTLLGMFFMISSMNFLLFYLGLELSTIPLAALSNFDLEKKKSSEAAFKLIISSAFSSAILLFGISMLYGTTGTISFAEMPSHLTGSDLQILSLIIIFSGFAFKLSAVPFHLWTADVYEGSPVAVTAYLSVISKGAIMFIFISALYTVFQSMFHTWYNILFITSVITIIIGNLFALRQNNIKRFLAFSTITQAGYILLGISANSPIGTASAVYFILVYICSNLGAFGVVSLVSALTEKENIDDYKGFYTTNPLLSLTLTLSLFSLAGIPPTAGFFGKFFLISAGATSGNYIFVAIAAMNMVISLYYYLRVVRAIFMDKNDTPIERLTSPLSMKVALLICVSGIVLIGLISHIFEHIYSFSANV